MRALRNYFKVMYLKSDWAGFPRFDFKSWSLPLIKHRLEVRYEKKKKSCVHGNNWYSKQSSVKPNGNNELGVLTRHFCLLPLCKFCCSNKREYHWIRGLCRSEECWGLTLPVTYVVGGGSWLPSPVPPRPGVTGVGKKRRSMKGPNSASWAASSLL